MNDYIKVLEEEIKRLTKAMKNLDSIDVIDNNGLLMKKQMQKKINIGYSLIVDVKMDLEKIVKLMGEK